MSVKTDIDNDTHRENKTQVQSVDKRTDTRAELITSPSNSSYCSDIFITKIRSTIRVFLFFVTEKSSIESNIKIILTIR